VTDQTRFPAAPSRRRIAPPAPGVQGPVDSAAGALPLLQSAQQIAARAIEGLAQAGTPPHPYVGGGATRPRWFGFHLLASPSPPEQREWRPAGAPAQMAALVHH